MKKNSFIEGTIIASIAIIFTKFLGAIYVIPFYKIIGEDGGTLYSYAYNIYNLFLNISIAGIPIAISKIISEYDTLNMYNAKEKTFKVGKKLMLILAIITFFIMFVFSEEFAKIILKGVTNGNTVADVSFVLKSISFCLLVIPSLSITKGYLQGHKYITETSISQVIEQIVRIIVVLLGSYLAINCFHYTITVGVGVALFGAFIGGVIALIYLKIKIHKNKNKFISKDENNVFVSTKEIILKIFKYSIPLIIVSTATNLYDTTNMILVIRGLTNIGYPTESIEIISSIIATWGQKICMIINSVAMGISINIIPNIVNNFVKNELNELNKKFNQAVNTILFITVPMACGLSFLATPIYTIFYGKSEYGPIILKYLAFISVLASINIVINMALQGMNKFKIIYLNTFVGLFINIILNIPLTLLFNKIGIYPFYGTLTATGMGYLVSFIIVFVYLKKNMNFNYKSITNTFIKMIIPIVVMFICLIGMSIILPINSNYGYLKTIIYTIIYSVVGAAPYFIITYKNSVLGKVLGENFVNKILNKLKLKKEVR